MRYQHPPEHAVPHDQVGRSRSRVVIPLCAPESADGGQSLNRLDHGWVRRLGSRSRFEQALEDISVQDDVGLRRIGALEKREGEPRLLPRARRRPRRWTVQDVVPGSAAAIAGIEPGDEVLALDRKPIETFALAEIRARLRQSGTSCAIVVERAGERIDRVMRLRSLV